MHIRFSYILIVLFMIPGIVSCKRNPYKVNISSIEADIKIKRLEKEMFRIDPLELPSALPSLRKEYGSFLQLFSYVINAGNVNDTAFTDLIVSFCTDKLNNEVYESVMRSYPDLDDLEEELEGAFRHYKYYFPDAAIPEVITCITGFNNSLIIGDSVIGIGLDRYLGAGSQYYRMLRIYSYLSARMNSWNIVSDCMYGWASSEWDFASMRYPGENVMTSMIHEGKLKYFQRCMMPYLNDTILFGFSEGQMKFCRNNEMQMWHYLVEHDLLFSTDQFTIRKLTGEAPFTTFFTGESPGRAATWLGFRIIELYMMRNRNTTLAELMDNTDVQGLLGAAKYDPK